MKTFNICRVITRLPVGGIERRLVAVLPRLNTPPFSVRLACLHERGALADELEAAGVPVDLVKLRSRLSPTGLRSLAAYFRQHRIDLVHAHMYRSNTPATIAGRLAGIKCVLAQVHNTGTWETLRQRLMDRLLNHFRTGMIAVSRRVQDDVCHQFGCPPEFVHLLYNGVDVAPFRDAPVDLALKQELGVKPGEVAAVVVARLHPQKNHALLLKSIQQLGEKADKLKVILVGDGSHESELRKLAEELEVASRVIFVGQRDDVARFYKFADFSILPSLKEGFSNTVIESMIVGCPVIATDVGGNREAIVDGETGLIVPSGDQAALARAIQELLENPARCRKMSQAASLRGEIFSLEAMLEATRSLYLSLLEGSSV